MTIKKYLSLSYLLSIGLITNIAVAANSATTQEAQAIAKEAYVYGFPMVMGYKTLYSYTVDKANAEYKGPFNQLSCEARVFTPEDTAIVTPNSDTPYCMGWLDLRDEPVVLTVPDVPEDRYYSFQLIDLYTHNFAYVGTLTTGNDAGDYLIAGPGWGGEKPFGITQVLRSETNHILAITRTQLFDPEDIEQVKKIQAAYHLVPLSAHLGQTSPKPAPEIPFPKWVEGVQFDERFFNFFDVVLSLVEPVAEEQDLMARFAKIGLGTDQSFDIDNVPVDMRAALKRGVDAGFAEIEEFLAQHSADPLASAKIYGTRAFLNESAKKNFSLEDFYILRATAAHAGLYGNDGSEALYPTYFVDRDGQPLDASKNVYTITFNAGQLPPVKSFWSLTMYDAKTQLLVPNPLERYLINSTMLDQFIKDDDGSITLYLQKDSPGKALEDNWLPAPDGPFYAVIRLYGPKPEAMEGAWTPPQLLRGK